MTHIKCLQWTNLKTEPQRSCHRAIWLQHQLILTNWMTRWIVSVKPWYSLMKLFIRTSQLVCVHTPGRKTTSCPVIAKSFKTPVSASIGSTGMPIRKILSTIEELIIAICEELNKLCIPDVHIDWTNGKNHKTSVTLHYLSWPRHLTWATWLCYSFKKKREGNTKKPSLCPALLFATFWWGYWHRTRICFTANKLLARLLFLLVNL